MTIIKSIHHKEGPRPLETTGTRIRSVFLGLILPFPCRAENELLGQPVLRSGFYKLA